MPRTFLYKLRGSKATTRKATYYTIAVPRDIGERFEGRYYYYEVKPDESIVLIPHDGKQGDYAG